MTHKSAASMAAPLTPGIPAAKSWASIYKSAAFLTIADASSKGAGAVLALLIARFLGPDLYGQYAAAVAMAGLWMIATAVGFEQEFTRRGGIDPKDIPMGLTLNLHGVAVTGLFAFGGMALILYTQDYSPLMRDVGVLVIAAQVITRFHLPFRHLCLLLGRTHVNALFTTLSTAALVVLTLGILFSGLYLRTIAIAQLLVAGVTLIGWFLWMPKDLFTSLRAEAGRLLDFVRRGLPFAVTNILWIAYFNFDTFFLSLLRPDADVGIYAGVYKIVAINYILGYGVTNTFTPLLFGSFQANPDKYRRLARQLLRTSFLLGAAVCTGLYFLSEPLVGLILGKKYLAGVDIARVLSGAVFFRFINFALCEMLTTSGRQKTRIALESALLAVNVSLSLLLIPRMSGFGSALSVLSAEAFLFTAAAAACAPLLIGRRPAEGVRP